MCPEAEQPLDITFHLYICLGRVLRSNKRCWETQKGENKCTRHAKGVWRSWDWQKPVLSRASCCNHFLHLAHSPVQCHRRAVRARGAWGHRSHLPGSITAFPCHPGHVTSSIFPKPCPLTVFVACCVLTVPHNSLHCAFF